MRLHAPAAEIAGRIAPIGGVLTTLDDETCLLETGGNSLLDLAAYLASLDLAFDVLDPPELRDLLRRLAERYAIAAAWGAATYASSQTP